MECRLCLLVALVICCGCSDGMVAMRLVDGTRIDLDWTYVGGEHDRSDRLLLAEDGSVRRNERGNLSTFAFLTPSERQQLSRLKASHGPIVLQHHSGPSLKEPFAYRLQFAGYGSEEDAKDVRAFADSVLARLEHATHLEQGDVVVSAVLEQSNDRAVAVVKRVLKAAHTSESVLQRGDRVVVYLPDARIGAGGSVVVLTLSAPRRHPEEPRHWRVEDASFLKLKERTAVELLTAVKQ